MGGIANESVSVPNIEKKKALFHKESQIGFAQNEHE